MERITYTYMDILEPNPILNEYRKKHTKLNYNDSVIKILFNKPSTALFAGIGHSSKRKVLRN